MRPQTRDADFSQYVVAHRARLVRAARLLTAGDDAAAEDLVQTTLTRIYVHWSRVSRADDPVAYGFRALTNAFLDERRRAHRRREVLADRTPDAADQERGDPETRSVVMAALRALPPRQRAVVVLRHFLQYDVAATAQALGCAEGTVKSQNAKALAHLRELLGDELQTGGPVS
jgi:RNA polymerase sigma-70 factor (sigma-E family)